LTENSSALQGWTAGSWRVERRIRRGRVADAFLVRQDDEEARVLRLLHPVHVADARALSRCLDETRALARPPHPALVPVIDAGQLPDGRIYLVGEEATALPVAERWPQLGTETLVALAEEIAPALDALHARGITHGHLDAEALLVEPVRLAGAGFGPFQPEGALDWTGAREPGRRLDLLMLGRTLLQLLGEGGGRLRAVLERSASDEDAAAFPSATALARSMRVALEADPMGETRHVPGPRPPAPVTPEESVPRAVGPYRILGKLGAGAMGRVFCAERDGRRVALKLLRQEHLRSRTLLDRFFREARAVSRIQHPHIVEVLEVGEERGAEGLECAYCVMELLEGKTLGALFRERALGVERAVEIAAQVCEALEAAHAVGVVHRDVKPDNVFVAQRKGRDWVKLLDFGIAKLLPGGPDAPRLPGTVIGTPNYMAPEQASGAPVDARTDLYALGVVLHELLAGRRPRPRGEEDSFPSQTPAGEPIPSPLVELVGQCLQADPAHRPASAKRLGESLRAATRLNASGVRPGTALRPGRRAS
jgi:serine/threonine protein kinase